MLISILKGVLTSPTVIDQLLYHQFLPLGQSFHLPSEAHWNLSKPGYYSVVAVVLESMVFRDLLYSKQLQRLHYWMPARVLCIEQACRVSTIQDIV